MRKTTTLWILALLVVLAMPAVAAPSEYYLKPSDSNASCYCNTTDVEIWINATEPVRSGLMTLQYDPLCGNITSCTTDTANWPISNSYVNHTGKQLRVGCAAMSIKPAGHYRMATFAIHCNSTTHCVSDLLFLGIGVDTYAENDYVQIPVTTANGTFTCICGGPSDDVDLNVTDIDVNPSCNIGYDEVFVNQSNEICATVYNAGPVGIAGNFDVCFYNNSVLIGTVSVNGLAADTNTTVCINWTPSCDDYPGLSGEYPAIGIPTTLNVTVDCNGAVTETDEGNNTLLLVTEVSANGYKSKNFDCNPSDPLELFNGYDGAQFYGGLEYNVSGTKVYPFDPGMNQTRIHHIDLPNCTTGVKDARLYIVGYDYFYNPVPGCLPNLSVDFNGAVTFTTPDAMYTDQKAYDGWDTPKWKYAYDVTNWTNHGPSNDYSVTVENIDPTNSTTLLGGILVVVYEGDEGPGCEHIGLWWLEGCDLLSGRSAYCSCTTEATATVGFPGNVPLAIVNNTELITFVDQGMTTGSNMLFNGINVKTDAWDAPTEAYPGSKINIETYDVPTTDLLANGNTMGFQDTGTSGMQANLAFLKITKKSEVVVGIDPCPAFVHPGDNVTVNITLSGIADYGSGTICIDCCDPCPNSSSAYAIVKSVGLGDSGSVTPGPLGGCSVCISASSAAGLSGDVAFATVTLEAMGNPGDCVCLNLTVDSLYDTNFAALQTVVVNCCPGLYIIEDDPPLVVSAIATPPLIYNNSCPPPCPRCTNLTVTVTDATSVEGVWVDLTPLGCCGPDPVKMIGPDGAKSGVWHYKTCANISSLVPYCLDVKAVDLHDNWNNGSCIPLEVQRVGDVNHDNMIDMADYIIIARYTVGLIPLPDPCRSDLVPPGNPDGTIDMGDALYIAMYATWNPIPGFPEPGSLCLYSCCPCIPCP